MQFNIKYIDGIFEAKIYGDVAVKGYRDLLEEIFDHPEWEPGSPIMFDETELKSGTLTVNDVSAIANLCLLYKKQFGSAKVAILVARDLEFGMNRMWQILMEGIDCDISEKIFKSKSEAMLWLTI
jgi:hypothetical protein